MVHRVLSPYRQPLSFDPDKLNLHLNLRPQRERLMLNQPPWTNFSSLFAVCRTYTRMPSILKMSHIEKC